MKWLKSRFALLSASCVLAACSSNKPAAPDVSGTNVSGTTAALPSSSIYTGQVHRPAGSSASYRAVSFAALPQWSAQPFSGSLSAFQNSCIKLGGQADWRSVCQAAAQTPKTDAAAKSFFERYFTPWEVTHNNQLGGTVTGYYEPVLHGDVRQTARARFPIYGIPSDFVSVPLPASLRNSKGSVRISPTGANAGRISANGAYVANLAEFPLSARSTALKGRFEGNRFVPYFTRAQINGGALNGRAPILGYADNPVELFFMHVQGSGRLRTPSGQYVRLGFADKNEYPYVSIGRYMADRGYLPLSQTSMQGIKSWLAANPGRLAEVLGQNPSYVFFRQLDGPSEQGPIGALGVPLSSGFSAAVDKQHITLGAPLFLATVHPDTKHGLNRLLMAQDTGAAIKGAVRVDYFWGYGDAAGQTAGKQKYTGYVWQLLPKGMLPQYRP